LKRKIACVLARIRTRLTAGGLLLVVLLTNFSPALIPPVAAAEPVEQRDLEVISPYLLLKQVCK
jgi:hypothetical protein